ncbi:poly(R)-hydroxyalkanoic acid synthase subunit PhaE [Cognatilysobacter segetis]|uniref:poly(R)-hydroxyalkanoic acid synthase subunit PhaE n=1 Tax=Cognatilysobacter segetis TaxID=2492394 RepID=UPI00105E997F|nr:poly(R)-hydroxyalkanoic acid synthase subunit PhaE [Lysobacter segetis]
MSTSPFGASGFGFPAFDPAQFERLGRQWFAAFSPAAPAAAPDPFAWWKPAAPAAPQGFDPTALAQQWMAQMQQLAAQFGGEPAQPADIARAWRTMLGDNPFAQAVAAGAFMPSSFMPPGVAGARGPFDMPAFGYTREHQERAQAFAKAAADFQTAAQAFGGVVAEAGQDAFTRFESLLTRRSGEGKPVESARALFDLWIDAAEDAYADIALGERFQSAFGEYVNAQMRLRAAMQKEVELTTGQWGIPGRAEVDAAHRRIAMLERELARLRAQVDALSEPPRDAPRPEPAASAKPAAAKSSTRKTGKR